MGISGEVALAAANEFTEKSLEGGGAIKGKNCTISSISPITGGNRVTFAWELDDGTEETGTMDVMDGAQGPEGPEGPQGPAGNVRHKYNVQDYGVVPNDTSAASDNVTALQALIDEAPAGSVIYFPVGRYDFDDGVTIGKRLAFLGENTNFKTATANGGDTQPRSQIELTKDFPANTTMFARTDAVAVAFKSLSLICDMSGNTNNFYNQTENTATFSTYPYPFYVVTEPVIAGVNGIDASLDGMFEISDCYFRGFTGYAIKVRQHRFIENCGFENCNHCIEITHTDSWVSNCWFRSCNTGIYTSTVSVTLLNVSDTWCDQMAGHFIHATNSDNVVLLVDNAWCDMIDKCAINIENAYLVHSMISGRFSRVGMTYAGLKNSEWTKEKSPLADVIYAKRYDECEFNITAHRRAIRTVENVEYACPCKIVGLYNSNTYIHNSVFICPDSLYEEVIPVSTSATSDLKPPVTDYNMKDCIIVSKDGIYRPKSIFNYKYPVIHTRTTTPVGKIEATRVNDLALDTTTNTLYRATGTGKNDWVAISISIAALQSVVAASSDFADFQTKVAAL